jgi:hypothetical protein
VRCWPIAKLFHAKFGRYPGMAEIYQALTPFNLAEAADEWSSGI